MAPDAVHQRGLGRGRLELPSARRHPGVQRRDVARLEPRQAAAPRASGSRSVSSFSSPTRRLDGEASPLVSESGADHSPGFATDRRIEAFASSSHGTDAWEKADTARDARIEGSARRTRKGTTATFHANVNPARCSGSSASETARTPGSSTPGQKRPPSQDQPAGGP